MILQCDRNITISTGDSRKCLHWRRKEMTVGELWERLSTPATGAETMAEYLTYPKARQDELKDVGGFVGGSLAGPRRKAQAILGRDVVTLDFDSIPPNGTETVIQTAEGLGYACCIYSTRKHTPAAPRLRVLFALDRTVSAEEYEPIARRLAERIGIEMADPTTYEPARLMYWPSCCRDAEFIWKYHAAPLCPADEILDGYADWHDLKSWPGMPQDETGYRRYAAKQGDPAEKPGFVGAFNRAHPDILQTIADFLPGVYEPTADPDRLTYTGGSTTGGAVLYDGRRFLYSHHATDPCSGRLVNSFDLVRLHKFGMKDEGVDPGTPGSKLPSYLAMIDFAGKDPLTRIEAVNASTAAAAKDFEGIQPEQAGRRQGAEGEEEESYTAGTDGGKEDDSWKAELVLDSRERTKPTINNILIILNHDPALAGKFGLNEFAGQGEILAPVPWDRGTKRRLWTDTDNNGVYWYLEYRYGITGRKNIDAALDLHASQHAFNDVKAYLDGLVWDGTPRLDTVLVDYLGAEDTEYTRAVTRKAFTAAVARVFEPGCKYDNMLILCGRQGIGKSTFLEKMAHGWFENNISTFEGKEASERLPGVWLVEVAELDAFRRTDVARIKQFLSLSSDRYRAAYGRHVQELPRRCVFFGTCNERAFLRDVTGNRRFWPVDTGIHERTRKPWDLTDTDRDQLWAEARARQMMGEKLFLTEDLEQMAWTQQDSHFEESPRKGMVLEFIGRKVPRDWQRYTIASRQMYWGVHEDETGTAEDLVPRDRICALEVWCECFNGDPRTITRADVREINSIIARAEGWTDSAKSVRVGPYGVQKGFLAAP